MRKITVIGLGYVGLPTAILAAQHGYDVSGFDIDEEKAEKIRMNTATIIEPEISSRLNEVIFSEKLKIVNEVSESDCFLITVPTPLKKDNKADMSAVFDAGGRIAKVLKPGNLVILESTVKVGTTEELASILEEKSGLKLGIDFYVSYCPERILPGKIFKELINNNRVIGATCSGAAELTRVFYTRFVKGELEFTDDKTAEMVKLVENSSRDIQIAFANQVASMASNIGVDPYKVIYLANKHPRVNILNPTCGVGGHCIAVDPWFLIESFPKSSKLLQLSRAINDQKPLTVINNVLTQAKKFIESNNKKPVVGAFGLSFKPDVDDLRESPALKIVRELNKKNDLLDLLAYDSYVDKKVFINSGLVCIDKLNDILKKADILLFLVGHKEFFKIGEKDLIGKKIIDTAGLLNFFERNKTSFFLHGAIKDIELKPINLT